MNILIFSDDKISKGVLASRLSIKAPKAAKIATVEPEKIESLGLTDPREQSYIIVTGENLVKSVTAIRAGRVNLPLVAATPAGCTESLVALLDAGCDDVVSATVDTDELFARLRAISRRASGLVTNEVKIGALTIRLDRSDPEYNGRRIKLSKIESAILDMLARRPGHPVSREAIFAAVWPNDDKQPYDKVLDVHIHNLRKKLAAASGGERYIETVPSRGFFLERRRRQNQYPIANDGQPGMPSSGVVQAS